MMAQGPRVVAELGRPETPDETAARKAASSRAYRSSQTFRNLIAAIVATLAIVLVIVLLVPRGEPAPRDPIDVAAVARQVSEAEGRTAVAPDLGDGWVVNLAQLDDVGGLGAWTVVVAQDEDHGVGFVRVAQGFDADAAWATRVLSGASADGTVTIGGVEWTTYDIPDPSRVGNVSAAISTTAGPDTVLVYGSDDESLEAAAASIADQIRAVQEETAE